MNLVLKPNGQLYVLEYEHPIKITKSVDEGVRAKALSKLSQHEREVLGL